MPSIYKKLRWAKAGVELSDDEVAYQTLLEKMSGPESDRIDIEKVLIATDSRLDELCSLRMRVTVALTAVFILLFAAISGVAFEISLLGVKLSGVEKIKEIVLLLITGAGILAQVLDFQIDDLRAMRRVLLTRQIGEQAYLNIRATLRHENVLFGHSFVLFNTSYDVMGWRQRAEWLNLVLVLVSFLIVVLASIWIGIIILLDIWRDPNIDPWLSASIVFVCGFLQFGQLIVTFFRTSRKATYIDESRWKEFPFYKADTTELSDEAQAFISAELSKKH